MLDTKRTAAGAYTDAVDPARTFTVLVATRSSVALLRLVGPTATSASVLLERDVSTVDVSITLRAPLSDTILLAVTRTFWELSATELPPCSDSMSGAEATNSLEEVSSTLAEPKKDTVLPSATPTRPPGELSDTTPGACSARAFEE